MIEIILLILGLTSAVLIFLATPFIIIYCALISATWDAMKKEKEENKEHNP